MISSVSLTERLRGEGYGTPTDLRYRINSVSLRLVPAEPTAS